MSSSARVDPNIFCEILPTHRTGTVHQELSRTGYALTIGSPGGMEQLVTANNFRLWVGKEEECIAFLAAKPLGDIWRVDADRNREDILHTKLRKTLFDAS